MGQPVVFNTTISDVVFNAFTADVGVGLSTAICKDGQTTTTAVIPFAQGLSAKVGVALSDAAATGVQFGATNTTNGAASYAAYYAYNSGSSAIGTAMRSPTFTPAGVYRADGGIIECTGAGGLTLNTLGGVYSIYFGINSVEKARFGTDGSFLVGTTTDGGTLGSAKLAVEGAGAGSTAIQYTRQTSTGYAHSWRVDNSSGSFLNMTFNGTTQIGSITITGGGTGVNYATSSDYRLKAQIMDLGGSGAFIDGLQPRTWYWAANGERGAGFVAHELQSVSPSSVTGEKDGEEMQSASSSSPEIMANIVAELKSLRARVAELEAR